MADEPLYIPERDFVRLTHSRWQPEWQPPRYGSSAFKDYARVLHSASLRRLQGKMQLFPVGGNAILRTRLTHSLEVAEIAVRIALWLNGPHGHEYFRLRPDFAIDRDVVATAALAHDLGHPPFGHAGEAALNAAMGRAGTFEGNAQTLRILTRLEQRHDGNSIKEIPKNFNGSEPIDDGTAGLDLCYRTLAAVIKYDQNTDDAMHRAEQRAKISDREEVYKTVFKGYYKEESGAVETIREQLIGEARHPLETIECQIMDIADDIAYSTYDLEDAMVSGVITPFDVISCKDEHLSKISRQVENKLKTFGYSIRIDEKDVLAILMQVFSNILSFNDEHDYRENTILQRITFVARSYRENLQHAKSPPIRRRFMETLIEGAVRSITVQSIDEIPMLSKVSVDLAKLLEIECLKAFTFWTVTSSRESESYAYRSSKIIGTLWKELSQDNKGTLLPDDMRPLYYNAPGRESVLMVRDWIATMTDVEAAEAYRKITA